MPGRRRAALLWILAFALPALVLAAKIPSRPRILAVLNDAAHAPVFAAFAVVILLLLHRRIPLVPARYAASLLLAVAIGGAIELVQPFIGRGAQWSDLLTDGLGAIAGLAVAGWFNAHASCRPPGLCQRVALALIAVAAAAPVVWPVAEASIAYRVRSSRFPTLFENRSSIDQYFIRLRGVTADDELLPDRWRRPGDSPSLHIRVHGKQFPGVTLAEPAADWTGHLKLMLDLTNPAPQPLALTLRVHDRMHDNEAGDRFNRSLVLPGESREVIAIPLADIAAAPQGRTLDLSQVDGLILFGDGDASTAGRAFYVTRIWLE